MELSTKYPKLSKEIESAKQYGYSDDEIQQHIYGKVKKALDVGYTIREVRGYLGTPVVASQEKPSLLQSINEQEKDIIGGIGETAANLAMGAVSFPVGGLAGIAGGFVDQVKGGGDQSGFEEAGKWQDAVSKFLSFPITTKTGEIGTKVVAWPFEKIREVSRLGGDQVLKLTGSKEAAVATATLLEFGLLSLIPKVGKQVKVKVVDPIRARTAIETIGKQPPKVQQVISKTISDVSEKVSTKIAESKEAKPTEASIEQPKIETKQPIIAATAESEKPLGRVPKDLEQTVDALSRGEKVAPEILDKYPELKGFKVTERKLAQELEQATAGATERGAITLEIKGKPKAEKFEIPDQKVEQFFQETEGITKEPFIEKVRNTAIEFVNMWTRERQHLPKTGEFADIAFELNRLDKQKGKKFVQAVQDIHGITYELDRNSYDIFRKKVVLDDLADMAKKDKGLPRGFTKETIQQAKSEVDAKVAQYPHIQNAVTKRNTLWKSLREEYIDIMGKVGKDVSFIQNNPDYFRHQVLEQANANTVFGTGKRLRVPAGRSFLKKRTGSELDINTDYIQAETEVLSQMLNDMEVARVINAVGSNQKINIADNVKASAKKQKLSDWHEAIPEGYTTWQPREGSTFYMGDTIPAKVAHRILEAVADGKEGGIVLPQEVRKALIAGGKRTEFVIKTELAQTLDNLSSISSKSIISRGSKAIMKTWKLWTLLSPRRVTKYNLRNISGDADACFVGNPSGFTKVPHVIKELYNVYYKGKFPKGDLAKWVDMGGMELTLPAQEIGDLGKLHIFMDKVSQKQGVKITDIPAKAWKGYWRQARLSTEFRESILRYANYLDYLEQMKKNPNGLPKNYGASIPNEIKGLSNIEKRAFWLSNDLLGAYDRISVAGKIIREHIFPFWSWKELNFKRYVRLARNAANTAELGKMAGKKVLGTAVRSPLIAYRMGKFLVKATALWTMLQVANNTLFPDEEKDLPTDVSSRTHITLGRTKEGKVLFFNRLGALGDFLEWFGLDASPDLVNRWLKGKMTAKEVIGEMAKSPINVIVQGAAPYFKVPAELLTKRSIFPDAFKPRTIRDRGFFLSRQLGLENEYKALFGKPSRGYSKSTLGYVAYEIDPGQVAYEYIIDEKSRYLRKVGRGGEGFWTSPRGDALYNFRLALRYGDRDAANKYLVKYYQYGGTEEGVMRSVAAMHPLAGLNEIDTEAFQKSLNQDDVEKLNKAVRFYELELTGGGKK